MIETFICKAFKVAAVVGLLQDLDNEADERLELARRVKIDEKRKLLNQPPRTSQGIAGIHRSGKIINDTITLKLSSISILNILINFHEIFRAS